MLEGVLRALTEGGLFDVDSLAQKLNVSRPMLETMLNDLERMGYLNAMQPACEKHCAGCSSESICTIIGGAHIWSLSEKGRRAIARLQAESVSKSA